MDEIQKLTVQSVVNIIPQAPVVSVVDAPWVAVTSVNGMTGDVEVEPRINGFKANHFYREGTIILYEEGLYVAKVDFTSGETFVADDWTQIRL